MTRVSVSTLQHCTHSTSVSSATQHVPPHGPRSLSRIFHKIRLAETFLWLISGLAEFLRKPQNSAKNTAEHQKFCHQDRQIKTIKI